jgi:hypothetical protein
VHCLGFLDRRSVGRRHQTGFGYSNGRCSCRMKPCKSGWAATACRGATSCKRIQKRCFPHSQSNYPPCRGHGGAVSDTPALARGLWVCRERQVNGARGTVREVRMITSQ